MITTRRLIVSVVIAVAAFAGYFILAKAAIPGKDEMQAFSSSFAPLSAFFTALAFFALALNSMHQASEIKKTKADLQKERNERIETVILTARIQAGGMRLLAMVLEKDPNAQKARAELEGMSQEMEKRFREMTK